MYLSLEKRIHKTKTSIRRIPQKLDAIRHLARNYTSREKRSPLGIHVIGGLGDHLITARFLKDFLIQEGCVSFDIYSRRTALSEWLFAGMPGCRQIAPASYDLRWTQAQYALHLSAIGYLAVDHVKPRMLHNQDLHPLRRLNEALAANTHKLHKFIKAQPQLDGYLGHYVVAKGFTRHNFLHQLAGIAYSGDTLSLPTDEDALQTFGLTGKRYITVSNGYDDATEVEPGQVVTKVYPFHAEVMARLKKTYPDLTVVQIGAHTSTPIDAADVSLIGKTSLAQVASLLQHALFHVDNEGGLVHLARAVGTRCCVVFGPTLVGYFGYDANLNIAPRECGGCWWMEGRWMTRCVKGASQPPCMYTQSPLDVVAQIEMTFAPELAPLRATPPPSIPDPNSPHRGRLGAHPHLSGGRHGAHKSQTLRASPGIFWI
jgi:hypothetical protein